MFVIRATITWVGPVRDRIMGKIADAGMLAALKTVELDDDFYFRMNAARSSGRPLAEALGDWTESVRTRAEYRERVTVNLLSSSFILYNAVLVGSFGYCFFHIELQLINMSIMW